MEKIKFLLIIFTLPFVFACFQSQTHKDTSTGVYYLVKKSETIEGIARAYGVPEQQLISVNNIKADHPVQEGSVIFIPSAGRVQNKVIADTTPKQIVRKTETTKKIDSSVKDSMIKKQEKEVKPLVEVTDIDVAKPRKASVDATRSSETKKSKMVIIAEPEKTTVPATIPSGGKETAPSPSDVTDEKTSVKIVPDKKVADDRILTPSPTAEPEEKITTGKNKFIWPVRGTVAAHFGKQPNKTFHNWIKIVSAAGVRVKAAEAGTVIFSSHLKNYGETIIIRHNNNFATVYTHLKKRNVKIDKTVKKGETIAVLGEKDEDGAVYMNFEIRLQGKARNPLLFLP